MKEINKKNEVEKKRIESCLCVSTRVGCGNWRDAKTPNLPSRVPNTNNNNSNTTATAVRNKKAKGKRREEEKKGEKKCPKQEVIVQKKE